MITLTATEAAYWCPSGAILTYRRETKPNSLNGTQNARRAA